MPIVVLLLLGYSCYTYEYPHRPNVSLQAMYPMTPKLMSRYAVHSDVGVGLVASSFALGRFCTTSLWPMLGFKNPRHRHTVSYTMSYVLQTYLSNYLSTSILCMVAKSCTTLDA